MIRKAVPQDIPQVAEIYEEILRQQERGEAQVGWIRGVYPTEQTAREALAAGELFVDEDVGRIKGAAKINREQEPCYAQGNWTYAATDREVMVLHTLVVSPRAAGKGCGSRFVAFYERYAREQGCRALRMDTNEINATARRLYHKLGFQEVGIVPCDFNGIPGIHLVLLEKPL